MKKKRIITNSYKFWKKADIIIYSLIIIISFIKVISSNNLITKTAIENSDFTVFVALTIIIIFIVILNSLPLVLIYFAISHSFKKKIKNNATFDVVQDLDYYREKLSNLNPAKISFLVDLNFEFNKDIKAMVLYYEQHGIIKINNSQIEVVNWLDDRLKESDKKILRYLTNRNFSGEMLYLEQDIAQEVMEEGLIRYKRRDEKNKSGCMIYILIYLFLIIFFIQGISYTAPKIDYMIELENQIPVDIGLSEQLKYILNNKELLKFYCEGLLVILAFVAQFWVFITGLIFAFANKIANNKKHFYKRTDLGNELTEKIYGLKNFIKDFSNLSEANKSQIVLWEDFLVYAVTLEENDIVLKEIADLMHKDMSKYNINK